MSPDFTGGMRIASSMLRPPLVQALHVELQTNRAIVFTTDAVLIPR